MAENKSANVDKTLRKYVSFYNFNKVNFLPAYITIFVT